MGNTTETSNTNKIELITVEPDFKVKGFIPENLSKITLTSELREIQARIIRLKSGDKYLSLSEKDKNIVSKLELGYEKLSKQEPLADDEIILSGHELVEFSNTLDEDVFRYLIYRYKYNLYPKLKIVDDYPPCVQIEPVSTCNFRCVFCFQTDASFNQKKNGHMGRMDLGLFKETIDE